MNDFYNRFMQLCLNKNVSPSGVAKAIGLSNAAATGWRKGKVPSDVTVAKLANYFGVSPAYLRGEETEKEPMESQELRLNPDHIMFALSRGGEKEITPEMFNEVVSFAEYVAAREAAKKTDKN